MPTRSAGLAGALYAAFAGFTNTELLFWLLSGQVLIMVIVGGAGTLVGPIIGAVFFLVVQQYLSPYTDSWGLFFGLIFIGFVLFIPRRAARDCSALAKRRRSGLSLMALLEIDHLTRRFGGIVAVDDVSMRVAEGEVRAVIGPNGAGKSTLVPPDHRRGETDHRRGSFRR